MPTYRPDRPPENPPGVGQFEYADPFLKDHILSKKSRTFGLLIANAPKSSTASNKLHDQQPQPHHQQIRIDPRIPSSSPLTTHPNLLTAAQSPSPTPTLEHRFDPVAPPEGPSSSLPEILGLPTPTTPIVTNPSPPPVPSSPTSPDSSAALSLPAPSRIPPAPKKVAQTLLSVPPEHSSLNLPPATINKTPLRTTIHRQCPNKPLPPPTP